SRECHLIHVAPAPVFAGLRGSHDRMADLMEVRRRVLVRRRVAAADLPARHAHAEMHPAAADLQALLAARDALRQLGELDLVEVRAGCGHSRLLLFVWVEKRNREVTVVVGPPRIDAKAGADGLELESLAAELCADLDAQGLAFLELDVEMQPLEPDGVSSACAEADRHPLVLGVPTGFVREERLVERRPELAVDGVERVP